MSWVRALNFPPPCNSIVAPLESVEYLVHFSSGKPGERAEGKGGRVVKFLVVKEGGRNEAREERKLFQKKGKEKKESNERKGKDREK